jgi:hypothetical protein
MITVQGYCIPLARRMLALIDLLLFDYALLGGIPYNALYGAIALRIYVLADEQPFRKYWKPKQKQLDR